MDNNDKDRQSVAAKYHYWRRFPSRIDCLHPQLRADEYHDTAS